MSISRLCSTQESVQIKTNVIFPKRLFPFQWDKSAGLGVTSYTPPHGWANPMSNNPPCNNEQSDNPNSVPLDFWLYSVDNVS